MHSDNFKIHLPFELNRAVNATDLDPAFRVWYDGEEAIATYDMDVPTDTITVTIGVAASTFLLTDYPTIGELVDGLRAVDSFFHVVIVAARRDDATISGGTPHLVDAGPADLAALGASGYDQLWDVSVCEFRKVAVGMEEVEQFLGRFLEAAERRSDSTNDVIRDPDLGDTLHLDKTRVLPRGAKLDSIVANATFGAGTTTVKFSKCGQTYDGGEVEVGTLVTTVTSTFRDELGVDGIMSQDGERIVVEVENTTAAPTVSSVTLVGAIGSIV